MGAPRRQELTTLEARTVRFFAEGSRSQREAAELAGVKDPVAHAHKIFARPRVQSAITRALEAAGGTPEKIAQTYVRELDNPTHWQARLHAADSLARIMGEFTQPEDKSNSSDAAPVLIIAQSVNVNTQTPTLNVAPAS